MSDHTFNQPADMEAIDIVTLELEEGTVDCGVMAIFPSNNRQYVAVLPLDENGEATGEGPWLYRFVGHGDDEDPEIFPIESEEELEDASEAFDELMEHWEEEDL